MKTLNIKSEKLKIIFNKNGNILKVADKKFLKKRKLEEVYFSKVIYNKIKAWKYHNKKKSILVVPIGSVKFVFYFPKLKKFKTYTIGEKNYRRLLVPPRVWFGFKGLGKKINLIINLSNTGHNERDTLRKKINQITYKW